MQIPVVIDDETTICQHFGRAQYYVIVSVENGKGTGKERCGKIEHRHFAIQESSHRKASGPHGYNAGSQQEQASMAETIKDWQVLIGGGMGKRAYESMQSYNIEPVVPDVVSVEEAVKFYAEGKLPNLMYRLH
ncbi:MAG: NifB/NifX family molybdenum-iron cluster-binding protein [Dehalococcoidia bacterium]|nr:NifB/NifX family molybdenum-iron cluster-binding protein [Dehalococcoidia bacterium]